MSYCKSSLLSEPRANAASSVYYMVSQYQSKEI